jgi:hypothetical protein
MRGVQLQDFIKDRLPSMIDYIVVISSLVYDTLTLAYNANQLDQLDVVITLHQRSSPIQTWPLYYSRSCHYVGNPSPITLHHCPFFLGRMSLQICQGDCDSGGLSTERYGCFSEC